MLSSTAAAASSKLSAKPNGQQEDLVIDKNAGQKYLKGRLLGKGGFARCYKFRHEASRHICAGKCVEKSSLKKDRARKKLLSEIKIHRSLNHKNIVRFEHFFEDKTFVYILLEYCNNQTLMELVKRKKRLNEAQAKEILQQLLDGVEYLQSENVIHRDLKLGNIFLTDGLQVRIGDFGLATKLERADERRKTMCGTPNYIAPEILDGKVGHSFEVDIWSIGVILYTILVGKPPFETKNVKQTYKRIQANLYSFPVEASLSPQAKSLIRSILNRDPTLRPNLAQIRAHPFFSGTGTIHKSLPIAVEDKENSSAAMNKKKDTVLVVPRKKRSSASSRKSLESVKTTGVFVEKWVDYTSKYGLGYILQNGVVGVYFNDSTKLAVHPDRVHFQYYERGTTSFSSHSLDAFPDELTKKVTLLKHFRNYLEKEEKCRTKMKQLDDDPKAAIPYVKKWVRTRHAIFFRLSNKTVQVAFFDETQILLNASLERLTYFNKQVEPLTIKISEAKLHPEISKRLKYTKDVLHQLTNNSNN